jgi:hypothetical protein
MSKIATALALLLGLVCWAPASLADPDDAGATPASALPLPQVNGTGPAQGWRRHHRMQASGPASSGTPAGADAATGSGAGQGQGQGGGRRQFQGLTAGKGGRGQGHGGAKFKAVMALQSLTPDQRQKIKPIIDGWKQDLKEFRSQQGAGAGQAAGATAGAPAKGAPVAADGAGDGGRKQMRQKTVAAWQKVKGLLTDAQVKELDQAGNSGQLVAPKGSQASAPKARKPDDDSEN